MTAMAAGLGTDRALRRAPATGPGPAAGGAGAATGAGQRSKPC